MAIGIAGDTLDIQKLVELRVQTRLLQEGLLPTTDDVQNLRQDALNTQLLPPATSNPG
jgi:hypothetical protein